MVCAFRRARSELSRERHPVSASAEAIELVKSVESTMESLMDEHNERREHWYFHDFIDWEKGASFKDKPWDASESTLSPEVRTAFVLNLLTEDNLPYYTSLFGTYFDEESVMKKWSRLWTAEEGQHAIAMRSYLLTSRNCDPNLLEDDRMATVQGGWDPGFETVVDMFCYTSAQELATRISHRNAGVKSDCETAHALMAKIARDENHHFLFTAVQPPRCWLRPPMWSYQRSIVCCRTSRCRAPRSPDSPAERCRWLVLVSTTSAFTPRTSSIHCCVSGRSKTSPICRPKPNKLVMRSWR